jgi:hypothetical protein
VLVASNAVNKKSSLIVIEYFIHPSAKNNPHGISEIVTLSLKEVKGRSSGPQKSTGTPSWTALSPLQPRIQHIHRRKVHLSEKVKHCKMNLMTFARQLKHLVQNVTPVKCYNNATVQQCNKHRLNCEISDNLVE